MLQTAAILLPLQATNRTPWVPTWLTPLWVLAAGILAGLILVALVLAILFLLGRIPALGKLADKRPTADFVAAGIAVAAFLGLSVWFGQRLEVTNDDRLFLIVPTLILSALVGWGLVFGLWRRTASEIKDILMEGPLNYLLIALGSFSILFLATTPLVQTPLAILESVPSAVTQQLLGFDKQVYTFPIPGNAPEATGDKAPFTSIDLMYERDAFNEVIISSDRSVLLADASSPDKFKGKPVPVQPDDPINWKPASTAVTPPLPSNPKDGVFVQNREIDPATVSFTFLTRPKIPEAGSLVGTALIVAFLVLGYITIRQAAPRVSAVALATAKNEMSQLLFLVLLAIGAFVIVVSIFTPFYTMGEDIKVLKTTSLTVMMILSMSQAVWAAGTSIHDEIEGRTALTVLSKPISRRSFWLGKMLGILYVILIMFVILGLVLMVVTAYKPIYDARENTTDRPGWQECHLEMVTTAQPMALLLLQALVISGIAAALAPRVPPLANMLVCAAIYVVGNLTSTIVQTGADRFPIIRFLGNLIAVLIPNLDAFHIEAAVDAGNTIPLVYLASATTYAAIFGVVSLIIALLLFEDRDLA